MRRGLWAVRAESGNGAMKTVLCFEGEEFEMQEPACCESCGLELEWTECWKCLGDAEFDLYEEDPLAYAPGQTETCDECGGEGGWLACEPCAAKKSAQNGAAHGV